MYERLEAKVRAVNAANKYAMALYPLLIEKLTPFVGEKVLTATGELMAKVKKVLPEFPHNVNLSVIWQRSNYSLSWKVQTCELIQPHSCTYYDVDVCVGRLDDGILVSIELSPALRANYTAEEIIEKRSEYESAYAECRQARDRLRPFDIFDN